MDLGKLIQEFTSQIDSLKMYIESYDDVMDSMAKTYALSDDEIPFLGALNNLSRLSVKKKTDLNSFLEEMKKLNEEQEIFEESMFDSPDILLEHLASLFSNDLIKFEYADGELNIQVLDFETNKRFMKYLKKFSILYKHQTVFLQTSLIALTNTYEYYIGLLMRHLITTKFDSIKIEQKSISYQEIFDMGNIDEVKDRIISNIIEEYLRKKNTKWISLISEHTKKEILTELNDESEVINEIFQRRHIIVHNGAKVNRYFFNNVKEELRKDIKLDDDLSIEKEYLLMSLRNISKFFIKLVYLYWAHVDHENASERFNVIQLIAYNKLVEKDYEFAEVIYILLNKEVGKFNADEKLLYSVNYCQTLKWLKKQKEFDKYFRKIDFTLCNKQHTMCKHLLADNYVEASKVLNDLLNDRSEESVKNRWNDLNYYIDWPIFKDFKNSSEFIELTKQSGYEKFS